MGPDRPDDNSETVGTIFGVLSRPERRYLLYFLRDRETTTVEELTTVLAGWLQAREDDTEVVIPSERERLQTSLLHVELPKLEDAGLVRYDRESGEVALDDPPAMFDDIVTQALAFERRAARRPPDGGDDASEAEER